MFRIICKHYKKVISLQLIRDLSETTRSGSNLLGLSEAAESLGFRTVGLKLSLKKLQEVPLPCILHWNNDHFVVLYNIENEKYYISDPAHGLLQYDIKDFLKSWIGINVDERSEDGVVLLLEPTPKFYQSEWEEKKGEIDISYLSKYLFKYKRFLWQLFFGLLAGSLLQLIFPFLTQGIVDVGIKNQDIDFVYLILFAQLALFLGRISIEVIRSWILLHLSTRINISLVSDFFIKLMKLPIAFFDTRITADILQRINDHSRIEKVLTTSSLMVLFSMFNLILFALVLAYYNLSIFIIFCIGSIAYFVWITIFLKKRADLDYKNFSQVSQEQSKVIELIDGMQIIKLNNAEKQKRWGWEFMQARLFKISIEGLTLEQYQSIGSSFINELKNILITFLSAKLVIDGSITLGMMLAISYIVGQLNSPVGRIISFIRELQDAKISLTRLSEIHNKEDEDYNIDTKTHTIPNSLELNLIDISFRYVGSDQLILDKLNLLIPANKLTAIVGESGSGKTTLLKMLMKFYEPIDGEIRLGVHNLKHISQKVWREKCGSSYARRLYIQ